jgi:hypothetical protein
MPYDYMLRICVLCGCAYVTIAGVAKEPFAVCDQCKREGDSLRVKALHQKKAA